MGRCLAPVVGSAGERVLLVYPPGLDYIAAFLDACTLAQLPVPAYPPRQNKRVSRIESIIADAQPTVALTTSRILSRMRPLLAASSNLDSVHWQIFEGERTVHKVSGGNTNITGDTLAYLQYTSGSTGAPKGVMLSHRNLLHNSASLRHFV